MNKVLNPTTDTGLFNLQIDGSTAGTGANAGHNGTTGFVYVTSNLPHTIGETAGTDTVLANYVATSSCVVNGGAPAAVTSVTLGPGIIATCTITNTRKGMVTLKKLTNGLDNESAIWNFTLSGPGVTAPNNADSTPPTTVDFGGVKLTPGSTYTDLRDADRTRDGHSSGRLTRTATECPTRSFRSLQG